MLRKVLIVEKNEINRQMLRSILYRDYDLLEAENGEQALSLLHQKYKMISAIILDLYTPIMDGFEILRAIRSNAMLSQIPAIVTTDTLDEDAEIKALELGANDFIVKPYKPALIRHCLRNTINLRETASIVNALQRDKLSGLYNREAFFEKVTVMIGGEDPGAYIMSCFDIDNFKIINDQFGAEEGDRILRHIGKVAWNGFSSVGGIGSRISADNFAALYPNTKEAVAYVDKMREERLLPPQINTTIVFSVGRYVITDVSLPSSAIYDRAYIAKQSVKGRYDKHISYFDESMREKLIREQGIVSEMDIAIALRQFEVWFQPQFDHSSGTLIGAEALVRWRHPHKGLILPSDFIPVFEQNGFIYEMDKYVLEQTCLFLRQWLDEGSSPLPVSVNLSRYDVFQPDLIDVITKLINKYDIPRGLLRLEITESAFANSSDQIIPVVKQLMEHGFIMEIDDFGSGYSSLNTLKDVPATILKLDMKFMENTGNQRRSGNIIESVVRMAKWLGMSVLAEGVETREQADYLKSIGCNYIQGYLYARPMPADEYKRLANSTPRAERLPALEDVSRLDNNALWDPQSIDTLIFNSNVSGACLFEYHNGKLELLRANDKYLRVIGGDGLTADTALKLNWAEHLDEAGHTTLINALQRSVELNGETTEEFVFYTLPGCSTKTYLRATLRVIAIADGSYLVYCANENITAQREAEQQIQIISDDTDTQLKFLNDTAHDLLAQPDSEQAIELTLRRLLDYFNGSRAYVFELNHERLIANNTYEVCAAGITNVRDKLQAVPFATVQFWLHAFNQHDNINISAVDTLDDSRSVEKKLLTANGIVSLIAVPLWRNGELIGFVGVDNPGRRQQQLDRLMALGDFIALLLTRRDMSAKIANDNALMQEREELSYREMLPVALAVVIRASADPCFVKDHQYRYVCCSRSFALLAGLNDEKDIVGKTDYDLLDKATADRYRAGEQQLVEDGLARLNYDELTPLPDGTVRYANTSKYPLLDASNNVIGIYCVTQDTTKARETDSQLRLLTDSIPGGLATFACSDTGIRLIYHNDGLRRLFGLESDDSTPIYADDTVNMIFPEDRPRLDAQLNSLLKDGIPIDLIYRTRVRGNSSYKWINHKAVAADREGDTVIVNAVLLDVTAQQEATERLRISEEEHRLAMRHSNTIICRYIVDEHLLMTSPEIAAAFKLPESISNIPHGPVRQGMIAPETAAAYISFYESIQCGEKAGTATFKKRTEQGWRWIEAHFSTIFSNDNKPIYAVISYYDVTDKLEKETVYKKWQQSLAEKDPDSYTLFRCNLSQDSTIESKNGALVGVSFSEQAVTFNDRTREYVAQYVFDEDKQRYLTLLNSDTLLANYYRGKRAETLEYREKLPDGDVRWLRVSIDLVEYPNSTDVEAYLMFENIDDSKRAELLTIERAETDPLTGVLNRTAFVTEAEKTMRSTHPGAMHALLMLDVDGFKMVNDAFGHGAGDQTLIEIANSLRASLRCGDLLARIGGDEFMILLQNIPSDEVAANKARQINALLRKSFSPEVQISASIGVVICPRDGRDFDTLYKKSDAALYHIKGAGKDDFAFYHEDMKEEHIRPTQNMDIPGSILSRERMRRMLIVDDSKIDSDILANLFREEFIIEKAKDGASALVRLRHYGSAISVVLLDLIMPGMDGFAVLEKMQASPDMQSIPVVVVSGHEDQKVSLRAIKCGASDFVTKPIDADLLRLRVSSAVSKAENERLRAQNSYLKLQNDEVTKYRALLERHGTAIIEHDWIKGTFRYDPSVTTHLAGDYDDRKLWHILLSDMVGDVMTVKKMQELVHDIASDKKRMDGGITVMLKTPNKAKHTFRMNVYKLSNEYQLTDRLIITFNDLDAPPPNIGE